MIHSEPVLIFDREPINTRLTYRIKSEEENTMSISELAMNWIEHADTKPGVIDLETAETYIGWMDPDTDLPEDLTPEAFMEAWNEIIRSGDHEQNWEKLD